MGLFSFFQKGLQKTATAIKRGLAGVFSKIDKWDEASFKLLENALLEADFGAEASKEIVRELKDRYDRGILSGSDDILTAASNEIAAVFKGVRTELNTAPQGTPTIIFFVGVNGSGKTTTIGKLAWILAHENKKVMLAACDTFRAAAAEQLKLWAERTGSSIVSSKQGADPASVAFDAVSAAVARGMDYLLIDTAGRQQNSKGLMDELAKMRRIITRVCPGAPHETLLTIDASTGLNAIVQAREFMATAGVTGTVLTKLDGTGKGGSAVRICKEYGLPVLYAGFGEQPEDLRKFDPASYSLAVFGLDEQSAKG